QAGPGDRSIRSRARAAFVNATRYNGSSRQARDWVTYIDAIGATEKAQDELERQQRIQAVRDDIERLRTQLQVCRLQGGGEGCGDISDRIDDRRAELQRLESGGAAEEASDEDSEDSEEEASSE
ncbi:MAG: hypothetical protein AAF742_03105, partial [Pseudomonadota bacterium]